MGFFEDRKIRRVAERGSIMEVDILADEMYRKGDRAAYAYLWISLAERVEETGVWYTAGRIYEEGSGVPRDIESALYWYRKAADHGMDSDEEAMYRLGYCYENGIGVRADRNTAYQWYRKALSHGCSRAEEALRRL